jgi:peptidoglycan/LPS O-acetylase OafA/YrhL
VCVDAADVTALLDRPAVHTSVRRAAHLDSLRGVAIAMVVVGHLVTPLGLLASAGVAVFFALSGFLITSLLLEERDRTHRLALWHFYRRRAARLMPSLVLVLVTTVTWCLIWGVYEHTLWRDVAETLAYVSNWGLVGASFTVPLRMTWSLAIEEQFYLLWPLLIMACSGGRRRLATLAVGGALLSLLVRLMLSRHTAEQVYYRSDSTAVLVLLGCVAACVNGPRLHRLRCVPWLGTVSLVGSVLAYEAVLHLTHSMAQTYAFGLPLVGVGAVAFILYGSASSVLHGRTFVWLAGISYTLYLWQSPVLYSGLGHGPLGSAPHWLVLPVALPLAWLTSRYIERPVMRWERALGKADPDS